MKFTTMQIIKNYINLFNEIKLSLSKKNLL